MLSYSPSFLLLGISPISTRPFSPPIAFRTVRRQANHKNEKTEIMEGRCHKCHNWAPVEGVKSVEAKAGVPFMILSWHN